MDKKKPTLFTSFFILAIVALACAFVVSILVREHKHLEWFFRWLLVHLYLAATLTIIICISSYLIISCLNWVTYRKGVVRTALLLYWISVIILFFSVVYAFGQYFSFEMIPVWAMFLMSVLLLFIYGLIEQLSLRASGSLTVLGFLRLILFQRFTILGNLIIWLESGWHAIAVKFIDVLLAVWLLQSTIRVLWQTTGPSSLFSFNYSEIILLPNNSSNGSIFNSFYLVNQSKFAAISYSGHSFFQDIVSSIASLLWHNWQQILAIWFLLEVMGFFWASSKKLVIVDVSESLEAPDKEKDENGKKTDSKAQSASFRLADLLAMKLDRINHIYRTVDEKRPIQSACGAGEPIEAAIKVEDLDDISLSSSSQITLGPVSIPASSIPALVSHILRGPKIVIRLHSREQVEASDMKNKLFLTASMTGKGGPHSWLVECAQPLEEDSNGKVRTVDDMVTEMAHRIYTSLQSDASNQNITWRAMWNFNEGLRAYRDCLNSTKRHKFFLSRAEREFIDAIEEQNNFSLAYYNLGVVYAELDQLNAAESCFQKAIDIDPGLAEACYAQGIAVFRRAKETEQQLDTRENCMEKLEKKTQKAINNGIEAGYDKAIMLCKRVRDIKSGKEGILEKDFSVKARAYDLEGNARARLACIQCNAKKEGGCCRTVGNKSYELWLAKESLERAVHYSWMALIMESVLHQTMEDESKIVSECSLDLAYIYLKMYNKCPSFKEDKLLSNAKSVLRQAIYINPDEVNLYHLLAEAAKYQNDSEYSEMIYNYAHHIKPENSRFKAHLAAIKVKDNPEPISWLEELEKSNCVDEEIYERTFNFLTKAIEERDDIEKHGILVRNIFYQREKMKADLNTIARKEGGVISVPQRKSCACLWKEHPNKWRSLYEELVLVSQFASSMWKEHPNKCLALCCKASDILAKYIGDQNLDIALQGLRTWLEIDRIVKQPFGDKSEILNKADDLLLLGSLYFDFAAIIIEKDAEKMDAEWDCTGEIETDYSGLNKAERSIELSQNCFSILIEILEYENEHGDDISSSFYKKMIADYLVESGKKFLDLGKIKKSHDQDGSKYFESAKSAFYDARKILERVDQEEIRRSKVGMWLATVHQACEEPYDALKEAQKARTMDPLDYQVRMVLGEIFCELKEYRLGLEELNTALSYKPNDPDILLEVGSAYFKAGKDCKKKGEDRMRILKNAKDKLEEALDIQEKVRIKERRKIRFLIGRTLFEMGEYEEAILHLRILDRIMLDVKKEVDPLPALYLGYAYLKCNAHEECEKRLRELIDKLELNAKDKFYGREYGEHRHFNEIMARAYIYLAYSYIERDANICDAWKLACKSQSFIEGMKNEKKDDKNLPNDISFVNVCYGMIYGIIIDPAYYGAGQSQDHCIKIVFDRNDWHRKRKAKAHLAECAGAICYKAGDTKAAIDYLKASIALYPDAGAYLNLAKAKERKILRAGADESEKALISREIQELCLHVKALDIRDEHKNDLVEFEKHLAGKEIDSENLANAKPTAKEV